MRTDKDGTLTKEYIDYVKGLEREDLERFYIGADLLYNDLQQRIDGAIALLSLYEVDRLGNEYVPIIQLIEILKGEDNE